MLLAIAAGPAWAGAAQGARPAKASGQAAGQPAGPDAGPGAVAPQAVKGKRATAHARTVVTFAWGGGWANQMPSLPIFRQYGMHATYFVPTGLMCTKTRAECASPSPYLTLPDIRKIASYGNEIGGLSVLHRNLTQVPAAEAAREICNDRANLFRWGFRPTNFAYPFAAENPQIEQLTRQCGYNGALGAGELRGDHQCIGCAWAETLPPKDPMLVRAPIEVNSTGTDWTLHTYQSIVRNAQRHGGGWIFFTIHNLCNSECAYGITAPELRDVLAWLRSQAKDNIKVETMRQVIGGPVRPAVAGPATRRVPSPGVINSRLARTWSNGASPACFQRADYGRHNASFTYGPTGGPGGAATETLRITNWVSGGAKLLPEMDLGACAPPCTAGRRYTAGVWYKSTRPTQIELYYRNQAGAWLYWTASPAFPATSSWKKAAWTTPATPPGATAVSFGLTAASNITLTSTAYSLRPAKDYHGLVLLGSLAFVIVAAGLIARGQLRYRKHVRAEAELAAEQDSAVSA